MYNMLKIAFNSKLKPFECANELIEAGVDGMIALKQSCRVCLMGSKAKSLQDTVTLHEKGDELSNNELTIKELLESSTGSKINTTDELLPKFICNKCFLTLKTSYLLRLQSHRSENILKCLLDQINIKRNQTIEEGVEDIPEIIDKPTKVDFTSNEEWQKVSLPSSNNNQDVVEAISLSCNLCNMKFQNHEDLEKHQSQHYNVKQIYDDFQCKYCSKKYPFYYELDKHMRKCHNDEDLLACKVCGKTFRNDNTLRRHIKLTCIPLELVQECKRTESRSGVPLQEAIDACELAIQAAGFHCCLCDRNFKTETEFSNHMPEHSNNKKCKICNRIFGRSLYLESHLRKHLRKSPYKCPFCKRHFYSVISIRNHVKEHSNRAAYECNICDKEFHAIHKFIPHMKKHELNTDNGTMVSEAEETETPPETLRHDHHREVNPNTKLSCVTEQCPNTACDASEHFQSQIICKEEVDIETEENVFNNLNTEEHRFITETTSTSDSPTHVGKHHQYFEITEETSFDDFESEEADDSKNYQQQPSFEITELPDNHEGQEYTMNSNNWNDQFVDVNMAVAQESLSNEVDVVPQPAEISNFNDQGNAKKASVKEFKAIKRFSCRIKDCNKEFLYCPDIINHYMNEHLGYGPPFQCPLCTAGQFPFKLHVRKHLKINHINDPYTCTICSRTANVLREMQDHMRLHTNERPFSCPQCEGKFKNRNALKVHLVTHEKNKRFQCSVCSKAFYSYNGLFLHSKSHMENKDLQCQKCGRQCPTKYRLKRHMRACVLRVELECPTSKELFDSTTPTDHTEVELEK